MPCPEWVTRASTVFDVTAVLVAVAAMVTSAEFVALRAEWRLHGFFDPQVAGAIRRGSLIGRFPMLSVPRLSLVQLFAAPAAILCIALDISPAPALIVLAVTTVIRTQVLPFGADGSDYMAFVLTVATAIASVSGDHRVVLRTALSFIAAQLCLAYGASGVAKLFGRPWRAGVALRAILHTEYGHPGFVRSTLDRWPTLGKVLTWLVIVGEIAFPVGVVLGGWFVVAALAAAAILQTSIAVAMGLNRFTPWFFAAFPATAWAACHYGLLSP